MDRCPIVDKALFTEGFLKRYNKAFAEVPNSAGFSTAQKGVLVALAHHPEFPEFLPGSQKFVKDILPLWGNGGGQAIASCLTTIRTIDREEAKA